MYTYHIRSSIKIKIEIRNLLLEAKVCNYQIEFDKRKSRFIEVIRLPTYSSGFFFVFVFALVRTDYFIKDTPNIISVGMFFEILRVIISSWRIVNNRYQSIR